MTISFLQPDAPNHGGVAGWVEVRSFPVGRYTARSSGIEDDWAIAPDEPGIGITFEWERWRDHEVTQVCTAHAI